MAVVISDTYSVLNGRGVFAGRTGNSNVRSGANVGSVTITGIQSTDRLSHTYTIGNSTNYILNAIDSIGTKSVGGGSGLPNGVTLLAIDGGPTYYASNGFTYAANAGWDSPTFFPIGVWFGKLEEQAHATRWIDLNVNYMHLIPHVVPQTSKALLTSSGLFAILDDEFLPDNYASHANVVGLVAKDEPGTTAEAYALIESIPNSVQDNRFWYETYTNNQLTYGDVQQVPMSQLVSSLRTTPNGTKRHINIIATDLYWFHGAAITAWRERGALTYGYSSITEDQMRMGYHYNRMIKTQRTWLTNGGYPAPIFNFIENGGPWIETSPYITPAEMNAAVWGSIMGGARGVIYFNHTFMISAPAGSASDDNFGQTYYQTIQPGQTISIYNQAKATNTLVKSLATVLNSPFANGFVSVSPAATGETDLTGTQFDVMCKYHNVVGGDSKFYIFAMPRFGPATTNQTATFTIANTGATQVTVINENRTISITNNGTQFQDTFALSTTVHIYRIDSTSSPTYGWELNASNTGLARLGIDGNLLPLYTGPSVVPANTTISLKKITLDELICYNGNIIIDRCLIKPSTLSNRASIVFGYNPDLGYGQLGPVTIQDCDIDASAISDSIVYATCAIRGAFTAVRNRMWGMGTGIAYFGYTGEGSTLIEHNYVYGLRGGMYGSPSQQSHNESATIRGFTGTSSIWRNNKLISTSGSDSGALFIQTYGSSIQNVTIEGNYFETYGYCMPLEAGSGNTYSNMQATNNRFVAGGYGPGYVSGGPGWAVWSGNYMYNGSNPPTYAGSVVAKP